MEILSPGAAPGAGIAGKPDAETGRAGPPARLKLRPDFVRASSGGRVHSRSFSLQVYRRKADDGPTPGARVGLTVTRKVGNAVERNRIKRRLREALRAPGLAAKIDHDYVIVARREALSAPFAGLVGEVRRCLADAAAGRAKAGRPLGRPAGPQGSAAGPKGPAAGPRRRKGGARPPPP